ncbi:MAG: ChbG/HpnK family deacetylase [Chloroflexi bacterium]|nr:MAG: ChbG/HpnK family deacetylase [Chloroflexota bacterium]
MNPNPILKKLGFSPNDRLVIIHADDIGMCQSTISAFEDLSQAGIVSSGAVMVPCAWFPSAAAYCRSNPQIDMGVHLTLTCEWDAYRWAPVSTRETSSGLLDSEGYFHRDNEAVFLNAQPQSVQLELQAQIERALAVGIDVTHIDTHMGTVVHPKFIQAYGMLAIMYRLPPLAARLDEAGHIALGMDQETAASASAMISQLEEAGIPLHDGISWVDLQITEDRPGHYRKLFEDLPAGLSRIYFHPAKDTPETRAISKDWKSRVEDYQIFMDQELCAFIRQLGIHIIGYRPLRELMR